MPSEDNQYLEKARTILEGFARRTGLSGNEGTIEQRYLWTDAFAVQAFFGLGHAFNDSNYRELALNLIEVVHEQLGRFHRDDPREGWISGLPEEEGRKHPTAGGLRIGKKMLERKKSEAFSERLEWERDGQYFHYITRWFQALLQAQQETGEQQYGTWAAELLLASGKFLDKSDDRLRMYWKMSIDLSRPLVPSMGAHDPLEGLICAETAREAAPAKADQLEPLLRDFKQLCAGRDWSTTDSLGIGSLLLNTMRAAGIARNHSSLPEEIDPLKLLDDSLAGLKVFARRHEVNQSPFQRLAFRECGLSLGIRSLYGLKGRQAEFGMDLEELEQFVPLANYIETFWQSPENQKVSSWTEHLDINAVTLACSMISREQPFVFGAIQP